MVGSRRRKKANIDVFRYVDFREFLKDYYEAAKRQTPSFSHRQFSRLAGYSSPNFLKLVMEGARNLGVDSIDRFSDALGLDDAEAEHFRDLVTFNQATNLAEKNRAFERIAASRRFREARRIDGTLFEYLSHWYHPVIRELAGRRGFRPDPGWIAEQLRPRIEPEQAAASLELLLSLGLLVNNEQGEVVRGEPTLTTEHEVRSLALGGFHRQMIERGALAIETVPRDARDMAALTVCVSPRTAALVKERIHQLREVLTEICDADDGGEVVYQLNIQWFPLSALPEEIPT